MLQSIAFEMIVFGKLNSIPVIRDVVFVEKKPSEYILWVGCAKVDAEEMKANKNKRIE